MKCFSFLLTFGTFILIKAYPTKDPFAEDMKMRRQMGLECMVQTNVSMAVVREAMANPLNLPDDPVYKKFLACSYKKQGYQSEDGKMLYNNITTFLRRFYNGSELKILQKCTPIAGESDDAMAYNHLVCIMQSLAEIDKQRQEALISNEI